MLDWPLLTLVTFLPLMGVLMILFIRGDQAVIAQNSKMVALWTSLVVFALSLLLVYFFDPSTHAFQFVEKRVWFEDLNISYHMGLDGISLLFVLLSAFLTPLCILASWESIKLRVREYMIAFLVLETFMIGMFCALDMMVFYIFFEGVLLPMFLIIGVWGGPRRVYASFKFFLYTLLGSVLMLLAIFVLYFLGGTTDLPTLMTLTIDTNVQYWLFLAFFASFAVKVPMWPVHTWLPDAHVEAPTAGSVILAGVLLKMGGYGFLRFSIPLFPEAADYFTPLIYSLSVIAIIYTSMVALAQSDMKKLIAYSSVAHMGFVTIGMFSLTTQGVEGSIFQMLSHGLISSALFLCVGVVYDRLHSREIESYGGVVTNMPKYAFVFMVMMLGSVGLPGTAGFIGEFMIILGVFQVNHLVAIFTATGVVLGAAYMLWLYRRVVFGPLVKESVKSMLDLNAREKAVFVPLVVLVILFGVYPQPILNVVQSSVRHLIENYQIALDMNQIVNVTSLK